MNGVLADVPRRLCSGAWALGFAATAVAWCAAGLPLEGDIFRASVPIALGVTAAALGSLAVLSHRRSARRRLALRAATFDFLDRPVLLLSRDGCLIDANPLACERLGKSLPDLRGQPIDRVLGNDINRAPWRRTGDSDEWRGTVMRVLPDGHTVEEHVEVRRLPLDRRASALGHIVLMMGDRPHAATTAELLHQALHDPLTDLPNRALLADRAEQAMRLCRRQCRVLAMAFIDLDGFKEVNDQQGHSTGDDVLRTLAARWSAVLRPVDTLARYGGDEFVALINGLGQREGVRPILQRLLDVAAEPAVVNGASIRLSASIGVAFYPDDGSTFQDLVAHADAAMYRAKHEGRNRYVFWRDLQ